MKKINFNQIGGFPLNTQMLDKLQNMQVFIEALGELAGNLSVIKGCDQTGQTIGSGIVYINGELMEFRESQINQAGTIVVLQEVETAVFEDQNAKEVVITKYAQFGIGVNQFLWADFKKPYKISDIDGLVERIEAVEARPVSNIPIGLVALWNKPYNEIPEGWIEHIPMRGRTPVGVNPNYVQGTDIINYGLDILGNAIGSREHKLTQEELPNYDLERSVGNETPDGGIENIWSNSPGNQHIEKINSGGGDLAHNNMQPSRVIGFIEYVGL